MDIGFGKWNILFSGIEKGHLTILTGPRFIGTSILAINIAENVCERGMTCCYFAIDTWEYMNRKRGEMINGLHIFHSDSTSPSQIAEVTADIKPDLVVVDKISYLTFNIKHDKETSFYELMNQTVDFLKSLAHSKNVAVLCVDSLRVDAFDGGWINLDKKLEGGLYRCPHLEKADDIYALYNDYQAFCDELNSYSSNNRESGEFARELIKFDYHWYRRVDHVQCKVNIHGSIKMKLIIEENCSESLFIECNEGDSIPSETIQEDSENEKFEYRYKPFLTQFSTTKQDLLFELHHLGKCALMSIIRSSFCKPQSKKYKRHVFMAAMYLERLSCFVFADQDGKIKKFTAEYYKKVILARLNDVYHNFEAQQIAISSDKKEYIQKVIEPIAEIVCSMIASMDAQGFISEYAYAVDYVLSRNGNIEHPIMNGFFPKNLQDFRYQGIADEIYEYERDYTNCLWMPWKHGFTTDRTQIPD